MLKAFYLYENAFKAIDDPLGLCPTKNPIFKSWTETQIVNPVHEHIRQYFPTDCRFFGDAYPSDFA
jgi:hypothetical protein